MRTGRNGTHVTRSDDRRPERNDLKAAGAIRTSCGRGKVEVTARDWICREAMEKYGDRGEGPKKERAGAPDMEKGDGIILERRGCSGALLFTRIPEISPVGCRGSTVGIDAQGSV
jgi:hypothetical protein